MGGPTEKLGKLKDTLTLDQSLLNKTIKFYFKYNTTHTYEFPSCSYRPVIGPEEDYITDVDVVRYMKQHGNNVSQPQCYVMQSMHSKAPCLLPRF